VKRLYTAESFLDRPKGSPAERLEAEYTKAFFDGVRTHFKDGDKNSQITRIYSKQRELMAQEHKDVTLASNLGGGFALPKEIGATIDKLILAFSPIADKIKMVQVGTSDYQELVSIFVVLGVGFGDRIAHRNRYAEPAVLQANLGQLYAYPQISEWSSGHLRCRELAHKCVADGMRSPLAVI
jgi:predicted phage gp36 major capsid-like protein